MHVLILIVALIAARSVAAGLPLWAILPVTPIKALAAAIPILARLLPIVSFAIIIARIAISGQRFFALGLIVLIVAARAALGLLLLKT